MFMNVISQCLIEISITKENSTSLLVYANIFCQSFLPKILDVTSRFLYSIEIQECVAKIGDKRLSQKLLPSKCKYLSLWRLKVKDLD